MGIGGYLGPPSLATGKCIIRAEGARSLLLVHFTGCIQAADGSAVRRLEKGIDRQADPDPRGIDLGLGHIQVQFFN